jgi:hypothetical protein
MTRRSLPAWLLMAVMASAAMMPAVANAHPVSAFANEHPASPQNLWRRGETSQRDVYHSAYADSNSWREGRSQAYRPPPRVSRSFSPSRMKQYRAPLVLRHDYRRW